MPSYPSVPEITITTPKKLHTVLAVIALGALTIGVVRFTTKPEGFDLGSDGTTLLALAAVGIYFLWRALKPVTRLRFSKTGVWTELAGQQPWDQVDEFLIETRAGYKGSRERCLVLHWNEAVELSGVELMEVFKFSDLSISEQRFTEALQEPLSAYRN